MGAAVAARALRVSRETLPAAAGSLRRVVVPFRPVGADVARFGPLVDVAAVSRHLFVFIG